MAIPTATRSVPQPTLSRCWINRTLSLSGVNRGSESIMTLTLTLTLTLTVSVRVTVTVVIVYVVIAYVVIVAPYCRSLVRPPPLVAVLQGHAQGMPKITHIVAPVKSESGLGQGLRTGSGLEWGSGRFMVTIS